MLSPRLDVPTRTRAATVRERFPRLLPIAARALLVLLALVCPPAGAQEDGKRDCFITVRVRQALLKEPALAPLNLGVSVREGVATIYGSVPSAALARLAREKVTNVQGVLEVRSELEIRSPDDPLSELLQRLQGAQAPPDFPSHERYPPPGWLTSRWGDREPPAAPSLGVSLMPPVVLDPVPRTSPKVDLAQAVERARRQDARFRRLWAEVRDGIVRLSGMAERREDVMLLAEQISRLPGVSRVIIREIQTEN